MWKKSDRKLFIPETCPGLIWILAHHCGHTQTLQVWVHIVVICADVMNSLTCTEFDKSVLFFSLGGEKRERPSSAATAVRGVDAQFKLDPLTILFFLLPPPPLSHTLLPRHRSALGNGLHSSSWQLFAHFQQAKGKNTAGSFFSYFLSLLVRSRFHSFFRPCVKEEWITIARADRDRETNCKHMQNTALLEERAREENPRPLTSEIWKISTYTNKMKPLDVRIWNDRQLLWTRRC